MKHFKKVSLMLAVLCMWVGCFAESSCVETGAHTTVESVKSL